MIICEIIGGLGNQLFQYASAKMLSKILNQELYLDLTFFETYHNPDVFRLDKYNTQYKIADNSDIKRLRRKITTGPISKLHWKLFKRPHYRNAKYHFDANWIYDNDLNKLKKYEDIYVSGYFAKADFFSKIESVLKREFTLKEGLNAENEKINSLIDKDNSVMLHVRRGDYVNNSVFVNLPISYYQDAINVVKKDIEKPVFFVFSDDLAWAEENIQIDETTHYVNVNNSKTDYMELSLMASCDNAIIANSTFSWWGAWLIDNPNKKVIYPSSWFSDPKRQARYENRRVNQNLNGWQIV